MLLVEVGDFLFYGLYYFFYIIGNFFIGEPQHSKALFFQPCRTLLVECDLFLLVMITSIYFYNQF